MLSNLRWDYNMDDYNGMDNNSSSFNNAGVDVERKTKNSKKENVPANLIKKYFSTKQAGTNVLNSYRSVSYNFTLAAISSYDASRPQTYNSRNPKFVVATSKGKNKNDRINSGSKDPLSNTISNIINPGSKPSYDASGDIKSFNQNSPGSFDLFIDDVVIESTFSFTDGATTLPLKFDFEIIEPYSLNGFIEALQICALASGFRDYMKASYVLILDFDGIPDTGSTPLPQPVPNSSKVFFIRITGIQVSVTDSGTRYKVSSIALGSAAQSSAVSKIKRKLSTKGNTVKEMLNNAVKALNEYSSNEAKSSSSNPAMFDSYDILFPIYDDKGVIIPNRDNKIASEQLVPDLAATSSNVAMTEIGKTQSAYQPFGSASKSPPKQNSQSTISYQNISHFDSGTPITDIISSVIRDSNYIAKIIKAFQKGGDVNTVLDSNGFLDYFVISTAMIAKDGTNNPETNQPYYTYTYLVEPYKILYNMAVPGAGNQTVDAKKIEKFSLRNYRYFYTGLNTDIIDFKINLNHLFFEEIPANMGNNDADPSADSAKSSNGSNTRLANPSGDARFKTSQYSTDNASTINPGGMPNSTVPSGQGWQAMVKTMHEKVSNSIGLITGDLAILGDPYYLTAGSTGNSLNKNSKFGQLANGQEAATRAGMVLISLAFNNPVDIGKSGFIEFNNNPLPIGGLYQVTMVKSQFKDGLFKQNLSILRVPGQTDSNPDVPSKIFSSYPNPQDQIARSSGPPPPSYTVTTNDGTTGFRSQTLNLNSIFENSNTNNPGGLGGSDNPVFGAINPAGGLPTSIYGIVPNGANQLATGIRASASGLYASQDANLGDAALALGAAKILNTSEKTNNNVTNSLINNKRTLKPSLNSNSLNAARSSGAGLINNANNQINQVINQFTNDPLGLSKLFNLMPSRISGITGNLQSKVLSSLGGLSNVIPQNVNLKTASNQGVRIDGLSADGISKLPPFPAPSVGIRNPGFSNSNDTAVNASGSPLINGSGSSQIDNYFKSERENSAYSLYGQLSNNPLPVENISNPFNQNQNISKSVVSQYGSRSKNEISPLISALNNNNNSDTNFV